MDSDTFLNEADELGREGPARARRRKTVERRSKFSTSPIAISGIGVLLVAAGLYMFARRSGLSDMEPLPDANALAGIPAQNLLQEIDPRRDAVRGTWRKEGNALVSPQSDFALLQIPITPPDGYIITATVETDSIQDCLTLGLVTGPTQVTEVFNGWGGTISGLQLVDMKMVPNNETKIGPALAAGKPNEIVCAVEPNRIRATCNGKPVVNWKGEFQRLFAGPDWQPPNGRQLFIGSHLTSFRISKLELRPFNVPSPPQIHVVQ